MDAAELAIFHHLFASVAEEMGVTLGRTAYSPNIKERRDYSCAIFDAEGRMVAQAAHIPVHLGAMPEAVRIARQHFALGPGDQAIFNDPYLGGTHLPDISIVSAVHTDDGTLLGYVTNRAHHADIGGMSPGSMPVATELYQEGLIIPPLLLREGGRLNEGALALILRNSRTPDERRGDLAAQQAAQDVGSQRLGELAARYGVDGLRAAMSALMDYAEAMTRAALRAIPDGVYAFADALDSAGPGLAPVPVRVTVTVRGDELTADFTGSAPEQPGSINAVAAVTRSATYYVVRCLLDDDVPFNDGCFRPVTIIAPEGTVVHARPPRAVSAGNVETSQRITDVVLGALAQALPHLIPAASQGTMNNVTIGGYDAERGRPFAYYETIAGGAGAGPQGDGLSAVHTHMTNTLNTPVEALEFAYPFAVSAYSARDGTGGAGLHRGGDGIRREYRFTAPARVTIISERRRSAPWGLAGGGPGAVGRNLLHRADGTTEELPAKVSLDIAAGDRVEILTPGGGGWGRTPYPPAPSPLWGEGAQEHLDS